MLALVTGLAALGLYYYGLQRTPAVLATLGELAFPVTATLVGIYVFNDTLRWTQWLGVAITVAVVSLLPARPRNEVVKLPPADARLAPATACLAARRSVGSWTARHSEEAAFRAEMRLAGRQPARRAARLARRRQRFGDEFGRSGPQALDAGYSRWRLSTAPAPRTASGDLLRGDGARGAAHVGVIGSAMAGPTIMAQPTRAKAGAPVEDLVGRGDLVPG